jgi:DNA end-binding protein Ku
VRFHQVDRETGARVRYRRVVGELPGESRVGYPEEEIEYEPGAEIEEPAGPRTSADPVEAGEVEVPYERIVKGFEVEPDRWVLLEREEVEALQPTPSRSIEIEDFVDLAEVDPVHFEKSYFLAPVMGVGAERPYALLLRALQAEGVAGIGRFVLRRKEHLAAIRPREGVLGLETMFFADEVRSPADVMRPLELEDVNDRELDLARTMIDSLRAPWDPERYTDTTRERLLDLIASRAESGDVIERPEEPELETKVPDLMEALRASVEALKDAKQPKVRKRAQ